MQKLLMNKKAQLSNGVISGLGIILAAVVIFGLIGIIGSFMGLIQTNVDSSLSNTSKAWNNSQEAQSAQQTLFQKLGLVALVIIIVLILSLIIGIVGVFLYLGRSKTGTVG